jgi:hypothetical protein
VSTFLSQARARALRPVPVSRPGLTVVPKAAARTPRIPFVLLVVIVLGVGLVGLLVLNTSLERGAYTAGALRTQAAALTQRQQALEMEVAALQTPIRVAQRAERLGMVPNDVPLFLALPSGRILGDRSAVGPGAKVDLAAMSSTSQGKRPKIVPIPAGGRNTVTSGDITVRKVGGHSGRGGQSGDTPPRSTDNGTGQGTNNSTTTGH